MNNLHRKKIRIIILCILVAVLGTVAVYLRQHRQPAAAVPTETFTVTAMNITSQVTATGTVSPVEAVEVVPKITARVKQVCVKENDTVKAGQVIAILDDADYRAKLVQAQIKVGNTRAVYERAATLYRAGAGSQAAMEDARADYEAAVSALSEARAEMNETVIRASMNGVVVGAPKSVGTMASQGNGGGTVLMRLADTGQKQIVAKVDETDIGKIKAGQTASFTVDAYGGKKFTARVVKISQTDTNNSWDPDNTGDRTGNAPSVIYYEVTLAVQDPENLLRLGMTARVAITTATADHVPVLPLAALKTDARGTTVTKMQADGTQEQVPVTTGIYSDKYVEIRNGLHLGDRVAMAYATASKPEEDSLF